MQKFGSLRSDVIEQMRFKQRLKVIQSLEDTAKRSVVGVITSLYSALMKTLSSQVCVCVCVQVRAMMTESAFSIEELEELYCLFKVSSCLSHSSCADLMFRYDSVRKCFSKQDEALKPPHRPAG